MFRKAVYFTLFFISIYLVQAPSVSAASKPSVTARSAILMDADSGKILYSKNMKTQRMPASLTKVMTAMVVLDSLSLNHRVKVSKKASLAQPSKVFIRQGEYYKVSELLRALLLNSGNDAAVCLSEAVSGTEWKFAQKMTKKAWSVGAKHTRFCNASGLPGKGQRTTAYDMAKIMQAAVKYPYIRKIMGWKYSNILRPNGKKIYLKNHNKLLWQYPYKVLGKTGFTRAAGRCFLGYAYLGKRKVIVCVLNAPKMWTDSKRLLNYAKNSSSSTLSVNKRLHDSSRIRFIQKALKRAGCNPGNVDGVFGPRTLKAVLRFQRICGLKADGIVGKQTISKLREFC